MDDNLKLLGQSREITNKIQRLRKSCGVSVEDAIEVYFELQGNENPMLAEALKKHADEIEKKIKSPFAQRKAMQPGQVVIAETSEEGLTVLICKPAVILNESELPQGVNADVVRSYLNSFNQNVLAEQLKKSNGVLDLNLDGTSYKLTHKKHFFIDIRDKN